MTYPDSPIHPLDSGNFEGLTKREHFAALAMQGMCSRCEIGSHKAELIARYAVETADALIAALNQPTE